LTVKTPGHDKQEKSIMEEKKTFTRVKNRDQIHRILARELGDRFWDYRNEWDSSESFETERSFPVHLDIEINNLCNMRCSMCEHGQAPKPEYFREKKELDRDTVRRIIEEFASKGGRSIDFNGLNEPLLSQDLEWYVSLARDKGVIDLFLHTNAELLSPERSAALIDAGLTRVFFSIDGYSKETYSKIRIGGDFDKVISNIEAFMATRDRMGKTLPVAGVCFVRFKDNEHEVEPFTRFWESKIDFMAIQERIEVPEAAFAREDEPPEIDFRCYMPWTRMMVTSDGGIAPCCTSYGRYLSVGSVYEDTLEEAWNSGKMKDLRALHKGGRWRDNDVCRKCVWSTFSGKN